MGNLYPSGIDLVWLGVDRSGAVAAFITAGDGPIPLSILQHIATDDVDVEDEICHLTEVSGSILTVSVPRPDSFMSISGKGIFVYDWGEFLHNPIGIKHSYRLVARPNAPVLFSALPKKFRDVVPYVEFTNVSFGNFDAISPEDAMQCISASDE